MLMENKKVSVEVVKHAINQGAGPTGLFVTVVGFFGDFVKPLINLVPYFFVFSVILSAILWFGFIIKGKKHEEVDSIKEILETRFGIIFGVAVISSIFWLVMIPVFALTPADGVLASAVPQISEWQQQVMGRFDKIDAKLDKGFSDVLTKLDTLDKNAGIVSNPQSYNDYYHNAKVYELTGNVLEARKSYEKYFESNMAYFDPWISYSEIIKSLEGPSSLGEYLGKMRDKYPQNPGAQLIYALSKTDKQDKEFLLNKLAGEFPDYGPIFYAQLEFYSYKESGVATLAEQKKGQEALSKLSSLEEKGGLSKFFIDKKVLAEKEEFIKTQKNLVDGYYGQFAKNPIDFKFEYINNGSLSMTFIPMETVKKIFYRIDGAGEFKDTGSMGVNIPGTTDSLPNYGTIENLPVGKHQVEVKYIDNKSQESPVAKFDFEIKPLRLNYMGYKISNPKTGKAGAYVYYNFYNSADADGVKVSYSIDSEKYDQTSDGMIFLDGISPGKHQVNVLAKLQNGKEVKENLQVELN